MKHKLLKKLIIITVATSTLITLTPVGVSAMWVKNNYGNWCYTEGYNYVTGWKFINDIWYFFDEYGQMRNGWINSKGEWYYADLSGAMQTGVIQIEGRIHLFGKSGAMQNGKCIINDKFYDFDNYGVFIGNDPPEPTKAFDYYGNSTLPYVPNQIISSDTSSMLNDIPSDGSKEVKQYKVKFKDPDAEDNELLKTRTIDEGTRLTLYKPIKSGYNFIEWNTKSDGDGTSYEYDDKITIKSDLTLYAKWKEVIVSPEEEEIKVEKITVLGSNDLAVITTKGGSLQMTKVIYPSDATNQKVTWSVSNGTDNTTGEATISSTGKITVVSNGKVTVKATATDGSGIVGYKVIEISGQ